MGFANTTTKGNQPWAKASGPKAFVCLGSVFAPLRLMHQLIPTRA